MGALIADLTLSVREIIIKKAEFWNICTTLTMAGVAAVIDQRRKRPFAGIQAGSRS